MQKNIQDILDENKRRNDRISAKFNPVSGEGSIGERRLVSVSDFPVPEQWLPVEMLDDPFVADIARAGSIAAYITDTISQPLTDDNFTLVSRKLLRLRCRYDFPFWAATLVYIKNKTLDGDPEILFRLSYPQRIFVSRLEEFRRAGRPIRLVLLKARQWGGSTTSQLYMAWLQLMHSKGLNSLIIAHQGTGSDEIKDMFDRMMSAYPLEMLYPLGASYKDGEAKMERVGQSGAIYRIPQRKCKIKIGTAERPDSCRGGDYALVHLSEVGIWKETEGKKPSDIVRSACGGVLYKPLTMIVYESTANGHGNFFHSEYLDARDNPKSQFRHLFIPWYDIDWNVIPFDDDAARRRFAEELFTNRYQANAPTAREESGRYLWWLWQRGATLEGINWYIMERGKHSSHGSMAAECPSDDIEAFVNSGAAVFDKYLVENLRPSCRPPRFVGEVVGTADEGADAVRDVRFIPDDQGEFWIWSRPETHGPDEEYVADRYLTVVDVGGRSDKADWSVIVVFDRLAMMDGGLPVVSAQWRGHIDIDLLTWKAAQIASYYDDSLLVIESNTLETHDRQRQVDGDQSLYILNQIKDVYPNLYARRQSEDEIRQGLPRKYGFHTNISTKPMIITTLVRCVRDARYVERDSRVLDEYLNYERKPNGAFGAIIGYHDDLLMTRAIGLHICFNEMPIPTLVSATRDTFHALADSDRAIRI